MDPEGSSGLVAVPGAIFTGRLMRPYLNVFSFYRYLPELTPL